MTNFFTPLNTILLLGAIQGLVLGVILMSKKGGNRTANRILAGILFYLSFAIIIHSLSHSGILPLLKGHKMIIGIVSVLIGPLFFFYVKALTAFEFQFKFSDILHVIPFLICVLLGILYVSTEIFKEQFIDSLITYSAFGVYAVYIILVNIRLYSYSRTIKNYFSNVEKINLIWLRIFILLLTMLLIFAIIFDLFFKVKDWDLIWLASCVIIYVVSYMGLIQPVIFSGPLPDKGVKLTGKSKKYRKSSLNDEMAEKYLKQLELAMTEEKIYLNNEINLSSLAKTLGVSLHHLSQIINERIGQNFYDYINSLRIEEAKKRLAATQYEHLSISAICFDVGFNSLSAFNAAFKKFTGVIPSQFRDR